MKLTAILIMVSTFGLLASETYAQSKRLTLKMENAKVEDVLANIQKQSEFYFFVYSEKVIDADRRVTVNLEEQNIETVLQTVFAGTDVAYLINDRLIVLTTPEVLGKVSPAVAQQQPAVSGKVTDESGQPLPGVTIVIKGTTQGTVTNADGQYSISSLPEDATLVFSFVGMRTREILVGTQTSINVTMEVDAIGIEEVVAIGYGTARRKDITGSVSSVNMEDSPISIAPNFNALSSLKATTPGLNIGTVNSAGGSPSLLIRGQNSISGSNNPLIVLDGVIYLGNISDINPNDIASYDILKDASSTAVYGSRAANGVIIITTKRGKTTKPTIRLNTSTGANIWQRKPDLMDPQENLVMRMAPWDVSDPLEVPELKLPEKLNYQDGKTVDWLDLATRTGLNQNYQISVSGMGEGINYFLSAGYTGQEGSIVGDEFNMVSLRGKLDTDITDWLEIGVDGTYNYRDYSGLGADLNTTLYWAASPWGDHFVRGMEGEVLEKFPVGESGVHPLWNTDEFISNGKRVDDLDHRNFYRLSGYAYIKVPFVQGLSYRLNYVRGNNVNNTERFYYENYYVKEGYGTIDPMERYGPEALADKLSSANGYIGRTINYNYVIDNIINYKREFGHHYIDGTLVATRDFMHNKYIQLNGSDFAVNGNTTLGANGLSKGNVVNHNIEVIEEGNIGYLARLSYSYMDKYHITGSYRRDGSSVFGTEKKWGDFPSIGLAWTASEEKLFESLNFLDYLKIKASYGKNGNQGINAYQTLTQMASGRSGGVMYEFSDQPSRVLYGMRISSLGNPLLGWETTTAFNGGFESVLIDNRIFFDLDFYFSTTYDQLFVRQIPIMTGFSSIRASMGEVKNRGIELNLTTINVQNQDFTWKSGLTFWQNRNILHELYGDGEDDIGSNLFIGKSLSAIYGYDFDGIVQEDDTEYITNNGASPGDVKFKDISGPNGVPDGKVTSAYDRKIVGYNKENFRLNLSNTLNFKNLEFYILFQGIFGGGKDNYYVGSNINAFTVHTTAAANSLDIPWWTPENRSNTYPKPKGNTDNWLALQSRTFVRIQDVSLSYRFDQTWMNNLHIQSLKLYAAIQNLYTFTGWEGGGDPEHGIPALSSTYPVPSVYTIGLDISF